MPLVDLEKHDNLGMIRLNNGPTNAIGPDLVQDFSQVLARVRMNFKGMVLSGGEKFFSMGFDLPTLLKLDRKNMSAFFYNFNQVVFELATLPVPTCAAVKAHAIAGGAILMLAC
ncbi:MAG: enoyl-CoA hydratase/isomerase family protein, partial [Desulfomonilaceae bacterium]